MDYYTKTKCGRFVSERHYEMTEGLTRGKYEECLQALERKCFPITKWKKNETWYFYCSFFSQAWLFKDLNRFSLPFKISIFCLRLFLSNKHQSTMLFSCECEFKLNLVRGDGWAVKRTSCSCRRPGFSSQHSHCSLRIIHKSSFRGPGASSDLWGLMHVLV